MRYKNVSARSYTLDTTNVEYVIGVIALGNYNNLSALDPDFAAQESLESGWIFYWDRSIRVKYSGSDKSIVLSLLYKK